MKYIIELRNGEFTAPRPIRDWWRDAFAADMYPTRNLLMDLIEHGARYVRVGQNCRSAN